MRKLLLVLLALLMALNMSPVLAEETVYASNFASGPDGWYGRGAQVSVINGVLRTQGRQSDWNSPGRDFDLIQDGHYLLSVQVYQNEKDAADFMISVAHSKDGMESYENLAHGTARKGEWATLQGDYTAGDYEKFVLYVETTGASELIFDIKDFIVTAPDGLPQAKPTEPPMVIAQVDEVPSLKEIYADKFDFGAAAPQQAFRDIGLMKLMKQQFSILTPENELKPDAVLDTSASKKLVQETGDETAVAVRFDSAKPLLNFAQKNGIKVHGHVLVWHSQTPEVFFREGYDAKKPLLKRDMMLGRLENYIKNVMAYLDENYPGVVVSWDVVNEAIDDGTGWLRKGSAWYKVVGEDFVARAFEYARKYAPEGTLLYYNDYNTAMSGKRKGIVRLLESLIPEGNIDGYGFQMHHSVGSPSMQQIADSVKDIAALGLRLRVSELDVGTDNRTEASFKKQAQKYSWIMKVLRRYSEQLEAVQVWGLTDNMSWRAKDFPLLFDSSRNPKPAFWAVADPDSIQ
nr:Endo-1,4-beta-xylanase A precursor (EC 3.2.1.8) [uncultured bacterium]